MKARTACRDTCPAVRRFHLVPDSVMRPRAWQAYAVSVASTRHTLSVDQLPRPEALVQVVPLCDASFGEAADGVREPHRHDYHEILWVQLGHGRHELDGEEFRFTPGTATLIGRGQVHVMREATGIVGAVVKFREEMLSDCGGLGWLLHARDSHTTAVPSSDIPHFNGLIDSLQAETDRPPDPAVDAPPGD